MWYNNINNIHHTLHIIIAHKNISQAMHYMYAFLKQQWHQTELSYVST